MPGSLIRHHGDRLAPFSAVGEGMVCPRRPRWLDFE
jgi:hypothetical protein